MMQCACTARTLVGLSFFLLYFMSTQYLHMVFAHQPSKLSIHRHLHGRAITHHGFKA